jgi:hypothetical protein
MQNKQKGQTKRPFKTRPIGAIGNMSIQSKFVGMLEKAVVTFVVVVVGLDFSVVPPGVSVVKLEVVAVPGFAVVGQRVGAVILEVVCSCGNGSCF